MSTPHVRELHTLEECRAVVRIQEEVWGRDGEIVPASVLLVSAKRGGILLGAEADGRFVGFVWSMPGVRDDGRRTHWSHMTGVVTAARGRGIALALKLAQRERAMAQGVDLVEWTFDPLQAPNAYFNLHVLGAVGASYVENVYGNLEGALHRGTPTDRVMVEWRINEPHVARRVEKRRSSKTRQMLTARSAEVLDAPELVRTIDDGSWTRFAGGDPAPAGARRVHVAVPARYTDMQSAAPEIALEWRLGMRGLMQALFGRGYTAVDFLRDPSSGAGSYLFAKAEQ